MVFSTPEFVVFFAVYLAIHAVIPHRWRLSLVIVGSAIFYASWDWRLTWMPFALALFGWASALWMMGEPDIKARKRRLAVAVAVSLLPLLYFKYADFIAHEIARLGAWPVTTTSPKLLPLGISFLTFTVIAYVVDVHAGRFPLQRAPAPVVGYLLFFPHQIAGPILRPRDLIPQLQRARDPRRSSFALGLAIFTLGLVKKLVFADQLAETVERVYAGGPGLTLLDHWLAFYGFGVQIYCDFSGYTDMAIGAALIIGIRLPTNFRRPYLAPDIAEFWRRWHVTLSAWLRDYLFIPLGGSRHGPTRRFINVMITMGLGGLWHGANWPFLLWGLAHGFAIMVVRLRLRAVPRMPRPLAKLLTLHVVMALWILFRAPDLAVAARVAGGLFAAPVDRLIPSLVENAFAVLLIGVFFALHRFDDLARVRLAVRKISTAMRLVLCAAGWLLAILISAGSSAKFIYFNF